MVIIWEFIRKRIYKITYIYPCAKICILILNFEILWQINIICHKPFAIYLLICIYVRITSLITSIITHIEYIIKMRAFTFRISSRITSAAESFAVTVRKMSQTEILQIGECQLTFMLFKTVLSHININWIVVYPYSHTIMRNNEYI